MVDKRDSYTKEDLEASGRGELFGAGGPPLPAGNMLMIDRVVKMSEDGGTHNKGYVEAELDINPDLWFFGCHFIGDPVMPGCLGLDAMWQLVGFYLGWLGGEGKGRALGVGEVKFTGQVLPTAKKVTYRINFKRVITRKLIMGVADGEVLVDGEVIYTATDLKVGLFKGYRSVLITLTRRRPPPSFPTIAHAVTSLVAAFLLSLNALHRLRPPFKGSPVYPPPERLKRASSIRITLSRSSSGQREAITPLRTPWVMPPQRPQTKTSAKGRRLFLLFDREPLKRSQPCLPWLLANLPAIETGRPLMIGRDNVPWNALKYLPDTLSNAPFPDDRVSVSSCLVSLIFGLVERKQWLLFAQPRVINSAKRREDQCAKFTPMSYL